MERADKSLQPERDFDLEEISFSHSIAMLIHQKAGRRENEIWVKPDVNDITVDANHVHLREKTPRLPRSRQQHG